MKKFIKLSLTTCLLFVLMLVCSCSSKNELQELCDKAIEANDSVTVYYSLSDKDRLVYDYTETLNFASGYASYTIVTRTIGLNYEYDKDQSGDSTPYESKSEYVKLNVDGSINKVLKNQDNKSTTVSNDVLKALFNNEKLVDVTGDATVSFEITDGNLVKVSANYTSVNTDAVTGETHSFDVVVYVSFGGAN